MTLLLAGPKAARMQRTKRFVIAFVLHTVKIMTIVISFPRGIANSIALQSSEPALTIVDEFPHVHALRTSAKLRCHLHDIENKVLMQLIWARTPLLTSLLVSGRLILEHMAPMAIRCVHVDYHRLLNETD